MNSLSKLYRLYSPNSTFRAQKTTQAEHKKHNEKAVI